MADNSATSLYRKQQGMAPVTHSYDPQVVDWVKQSAAETGADPVALLATALQESGARLHPSAGDGGTSFGTFQFHRGGALGNHPPSWASTYASFLNRAQEFSRLKVHGGKGAAAVQRPADRTLYAKGVDAYLAEAEKILGLKTTPAKANKPSPNVPADEPNPTGDAMLAELMQHNLANAGLPRSTTTTSNPIQDLLNANAANVGIQAPVLAAPPVSMKPTTPQAALTKKPQATNPGKVGKVAAGKIIGGVAAHMSRPIGNWQSDNAVDIAMKVGTPIRAPVDGVIGSRIGSLHSKSPLMQGLRVNLETADNALYFAHLSRLAVKAGQRVKAGQIIGYSGVANGVAHLHLGVRDGSPNRYA